MIYERGSGQRLEHTPDDRQVAYEPHTHRGRT